MPCRPPRSRKARPLPGATAASVAVEPAASGLVATSGAGSATTTSVPPPNSVEVATFSAISAAEVELPVRRTRSSGCAVTRQPSGQRVRDRGRRRMSRRPSNSRAGHHVRARYGRPASAGPADFAGCGRASRIAALVHSRRRTSSGATPASQQTRASRMPARLRTAASVFTDQLPRGRSARSGIGRVAALPRRETVGHSLEVLAGALVRVGDDREPRGEAAAIHPSNQAGVRQPGHGVADDHRGPNSG
jgi:hypothetical protein